MVFKIIQKFFCFVTAIAIVVLIWNIIVFCSSNSMDKSAVLVAFKDSVEIVFVLACMWIATYSLGAAFLAAALNNDVWDCRVLFFGLDIWSVEIRNPIYASLRYLKKDIFYGNLDQKDYEFWQKIPVIFKGLDGEYVATLMSGRMSHNMPDKLTITEDNDGINLDRFDVEIMGNPPFFSHILMFKLYIKINCKCVIYKNRSRPVRKEDFTEDWHLHARMPWWVCLGLVWYLRLMFGKKNVKLDGWIRNPYGGVAAPRALLNNVFQKIIRLTTRLH